MNFNHDTGLIDTILSLDTTIAPPLGGATNSLAILGSGSIVLPLGNTAARPATPSSGMLRFNSQVIALEYYNGSAWKTLAETDSVVTSVTVTTTTGLTVSGGSSQTVTSTGTFALALGAELQGLSGLATVGGVFRTGVGTYASRTITGTAGNITVTNGDGVSGNPTLNLATVGSAITAQLVKITTDAFGRVTATTAPTSSDITTALGYTPVNKAGDTGVGAFSMASGANITVSGGGTLTGLPTTPVGSTDAVSKAYVDSVAQGLSVKNSVRVATTAAGTLASSFANGSVVDGVTLVTGDRVLIKNQAAPAENGIYTVNASGAPTRAIDSDLWSEIAGAFTFVEEGTAQHDTGWVCTSDLGGTVGTTAITWTQFSGAGTYLAGTGLTLSGNTFSITAPVTTALGGTGMTTIGSANQVLGVNTGATGLEYKTVTAGTAISVTPAAGSITIANTGVTSNVAGTGISVSGATGAVTVTNTGVTSLAGTTNQITASASTGAVTLSVPSTFTAPGYVRATTAIYDSISNAVSAAGTTQGTATALTASYNVVTTAAASSGVILPTPAFGGWKIIVFNRGANAVNVYPQTGASIDAGAANTAISLPVNQAVTIVAASTTQWFTSTQAEVAGAGISVTNGVGTVTIANTGVTSNVAGTGISVSGATGAVTITNTGVTSITGTANQITASASTGAITLSLPSAVTVGSLTVTGLTANSFIYANASDQLVSTAAPTNGQLLIGSTGASPVAAALTAGTGISVTNGAGSITIANTGVTSVGLSMPSIFTVTNSPVTTTGTLTTTLATQAANTVFAGPSSGGNAAPTFRSLVYNDLPLKLYAENPSSPIAPTATGSNARAFGSGASASAVGGQAFGDGASATIWGSTTFANGKFATAGDAQHGTYILRNVTTSATVTELFLDGASATQRMILPNNSVFTFSILIAARRTDAVGGGASYRIEGGIRKDATAASTTFIGTPSRSILGETNVPWDATVAVDTTNGALKVSVTGEASKTIRWVAVVNTCEVTN